LADVGWAGLFVAENRRGIVDFTNWYNLDNVIFMTLKPAGHQDGILALTRAFDWATWLSLLVVFALGILLIVCVDFIGISHYKGGKPVLYAAAVALGQSQKRTSETSRSGLRY